MIQGLLLTIVGAVAGFIDSIAGGGGLITLPSMTLLVGPGPHAIGTNKVIGTMSALIALIVYARGGHLDWRRSLKFCICIGIGSFSGSRVSPLIPLDWFRWILILTCPLILWVVWRRDLWVNQGLSQANVPLTSARGGDFGIGAMAASYTVGFYDGVWGPGGGTFMFLILLFVAKMPLLSALAASKLANSLSAATALVSYASSGYVHVFEGLCMAAGVSIGAFFGATHATRNASRVVRPVLAIVVALLIIKLLAPTLDKIVAETLR